ncbi:hypothetical protein KA111_02375 [Candidatus Woesebacteria bacterium]|nr:hypothetical protein [Candidatus Woesebacteria bacterium]
MPSQPIINSTTQQFLDIFDITNNFVIMKDGTTSVIISVDAMNFGLLAEEEQDSIMYAYAGLLNSINYPIQILIRSQTKDVTNYLQLLKEQELAALDRGKQKRIQKYREFVGDLIRERNVLDKKFFVIIPAAPVELGILAATSVLPGKGTVQITSVDRNLILEKAKNVLEPKKDHLIAQFARIGLYSRQLETQEIIQLFYLSYNPEASEGQQIAESSSYTTPLVGAQVEGAMNSADLSGGQGVSTDSPIADVTNMSIDQLATPSLSADAKFEVETVAHNSGNSARPDVVAQPEVVTTQQDQNSVVQNTNEGQQI